MSNDIIRRSSLIWMIFMDDKSIELPYDKNSAKNTFLNKSTHYEIEIIY